MGIILELQSDILSSDTDILTLLRKARLIAKKLNVTQLDDWLNNELNGYNNCDVPNYRKATGILQAYNPYNGWIPILIDNAELQELLSTIYLTSAVPELVALTTSENKRLTQELPIELMLRLNQRSPLQTKYRKEFGVATLYNVLEQLKNSLLDWSILLENEGIVGENLTFTKEEKEIAAQTPQVNNFITNIFGDVNNSQLQQASENSEQSKSQY